jgi:mannitol-1-phosphate/altronate dehydrogenase
MKQPKFCWGQLVFWVDLIAKQIKSFEIGSICQEKDLVGVIFAYRSTDEKDDYHYEEVLGATENEAIAAATNEASRLLADRIAAEKAVFAQDIQNIELAQEKWRKELMSSLEEDAAKSE